MALSAPCWASSAFFWAHSNLSWASFAALMTVGSGERLPKAEDAAVAATARSWASRSSLLHSSLSLWAFSGRLRDFSAIVVRKMSITGAPALCGCESRFIISSSSRLCVGVCAILGFSSPLRRGGPHGGNSMPSLTRLIAIRIRAAYLLLSEVQPLHRLLQ